MLYIVLFLTSLNAGATARGAASLCSGVGVQGGGEAGAGCQGKTPAIQSYQSRSEHLHTYRLRESNKACWCAGKSYTPAYLSCEMVPAPFPVVEFIIVGIYHTPMNTEGMPWILKT